MLSGHILDDAPRRPFLFNKESRLIHIPGEA